MGIGPNRLLPNLRAAEIEGEWARKQLEQAHVEEHLCANCKTPFGKSAVRCDNEPKETQP